jgi:hypothetical protein
MCSFPQQNQSTKNTIQALTEVTLPGPSADGRPSPTIGVSEG